MFDYPPPLVCLAVFSIWLVKHQRFIRERTRWIKKVTCSSTFLRTIFCSMGWHFLTIQQFMRMLKSRKLYQSKKDSSWKPAFSDRDNENNRWKRKAKYKDSKKQRGDASYSESVVTKWFSSAFKLGFLQFICKASLIFKSNLELYQLFQKKENYTSQSILW